MRTMIALACLLCFAGVADAQYVLRSDGYYYNGGQAYTRTLTQVSGGYYHNGCYSAAVYQASYTPYYPPVAAAPYVAPITAATPDYKVKLLELVGKRNDENAFLDAVKLLGLEGSLRNGAVYPQPQIGQGAYGQQSYALQGHYYNYPVNANTQYSYNSVAASYGSLDLNLLYQQAAQLTSGAQRLSGDASLQFSQLVGQAGNNQAKVAEILARAEVVRQILNSLQDAPTAKGFTFSVTPQGVLEKQTYKVPAGVMPGAPLNAPKQTEALIQAWGDHAVAKCAKCHLGDKIEGGFDLDKYLGMSVADKQRRVAPRVFDTAQDSKTRMPRVEGGGPGAMLTGQEKTWWAETMVLEPVK